MKKNSLLAILLSIFVLAACADRSNNDGETNEVEGSNDDGEPTTLNMNLVVTTSDPTYALWERFAEEIVEKSEGTLEIELYPSESLGNTTDMIESISQGSPVLQDSDPSHLSDYVPDFAIFMHPYLFQEPEDIEKAWQSDVGQRLSAELEENGLKLVTATYFGTRHLLSDEEVVTRDDTKGMNLRNAPTTMWTPPYGNP